MAIMRRDTKWLWLGGSVGAAASLAAGYGLIARPWHLRWGATREEFGRRLPGDELLADPNYFSTRAITIEAPPAVVWEIVNDGALWPIGTALRQWESGHYILLAPPEPEAEATWAVVLEPAGEGRTRVISRCRAHFTSKWRSVLRYLLIDPGVFVFEHHWLTEVKQRSEMKKAIATPSPLPSPTSPSESPSD